MSGGWARSATSTADRGYGADHQRQRAQLAPIADAGRASCAEVICLEPTRQIEAGAAWELAHTQDRSGYHGPAHVRCNQAEASRRGGAIAGAEAKRRAALKYRTPEPHPGLI